MRETHTDTQTVVQVDETEADRISRRKNEAYVLFYLWRSVTYREAEKGRQRDRETENERQKDREAERQREAQAGGTN